MAPRASSPDGGSPKHAATFASDDKAEAADGPVLAYVRAAAPPPPCAAAPAAAALEAASARRVFKMSEVARHNTELSCWLAIEGKVYDVSAGRPPRGARPAAPAPRRPPRGARPPPRPPPAPRPPRARPAPAPRPPRLPFPAGP
jgi:hypothetical protein